MAWFDDPNAYYRKYDGAEALNQGDIVIAPVTLIVPGASESDLAGASDLGQTRTTTLWHEGGRELPAAPALSARTSWVLAMVIPHSCAMEKEWNERKIELMKGGLPEDEAQLKATSEKNLDEYISLSPLRLYGEVPEWKHVGIRSGQRLGYFPVCGSDVIPEGFIDFNRFSTVHYSLIPRVQRHGSLSDLAVAHLHHALIMHFACRSLSGLADLEQAIGQTIKDINVARRSKGKLVVSLILMDGKKLTLESQDTGNELLAAERPPRG